MNWDDRQRRQEGCADNNQHGPTPKTECGGNDGGEETGEAENNERFLGNPGNTTYYFGDQVHTRTLFFERDSSTGKPLCHRI